MAKRIAFVSVFLNVDLAEVLEGDVTEV